MTRTLNERKIYSSQTKSLFINVLHYSLASNELLLYHLTTSNSPVKTIEVYTTELETMRINYQLLDAIDLSKVSIPYQKNIQGYMYHYQRYLVCVEEYLKRIKQRSDYIKENTSINLLISLNLFPKIRSRWNKQSRNLSIVNMV